MKRSEIYPFLNLLTGISNATLRQLLTNAGDIEELYAWPLEYLPDLNVPLTIQESFAFEEARNPNRLDQLWNYLEKKNIHYVSEEDDLFPARLFDIPNRPFGLFYIGGLPEEEKPSVAIIGARRCTEYGKEMAYFFARELAQRGVQVVSGMALGIDGYAGRGALVGPKSSYAVLGGGVDMCYPRENVDLYRQLPENGGIISERPPQYEGRPYDFPIRNRIISGLSDAVIVMEAAENSGSLLTVNLAMEQNREIFALPGRVGDRMSKGCNWLLQNGAQVLLCPEDVLQFLGIEVKKDTVKRNSVSLSKGEQIVLNQIARGEISIEELMQKTNFPVSELQSYLVQLEIKGVIRKKGLSGYRLTY